MEDVLNNIRKQFKNLQFNQERHTYTVNNKSFISVSRVLKDFHKPFDSEKISGFVAKSRGETQEDILKQWKEKRDNSIRLGHRVHDFAERYVTDKFKLDSDLEFYGVYQQLGEGEQLLPQEKAVIEFWNNKPPHLTPIALELRMYWEEKEEEEEFPYAGTADIILYNTKDNTLVIGDYKTNEDLFKQYKNQKLLKPFSHLDDIPLNKYKIQLSLYKRLLEQTGLRVSQTFVVWLKPEGGYQVYWTPDFSKELGEYLKQKLTYESW